MTEPRSQRALALKTWQNSFFLSGALAVISSLVWMTIHTGGAISDFENIFEQSETMAEIKEPLITVLQRLAVPNNTIILGKLGFLALLTGFLLLLVRNSKVFTTRKSPSL